jgi:hypothetical protein
VYQATTTIVLKREDLVQPAAAIENSDIIVAAISLVSKHMHGRHLKEQTACCLSWHCDASVHGKREEERDTL